MCAFRFSILTKIYKAHSSDYVSDEKVMNLFIDAIATPLNLKNKKGFPVYISKNEASLLSRGMKDLSPAILKAQNAPEVRASIADYFKTKVQDGITHGKEEELSDALRAAIDDDMEMHPEWKESLLRFAEDEPLWKFLLKCFRYTLCHTNKLPDEEAVQKKPPALPPELAPDMKTGLFLETGGFCPCDGCAHALYVRKDGKARPDFRVTLIDPEAPAESANLIALCSECSKTHEMCRDEKMTARLKEIKKELVTAADCGQITADESLTVSLETIFRAIADAPIKDEIPLNYDPVPLQKKLLPQSNQLYRKANMNVIQYYDAIRDAIRGMMMKGTISDTELCMKIKLTYTRLRRCTSSQTLIFDQLVRWIISLTNKDRELCEAVISYFIQNCEVFDAPSK